MGRGDDVTVIDEGAPAEHEPAGGVHDANLPRVLVHLGVGSAHNTGCSVHYATFCRNVGVCDHRASCVRTR